MTTKLPNRKTALVLTLGVVALSLSVAVISKHDFSQLVSPSQPVGVRASQKDFSSTGSSVEQMIGSYRLQRSKNPDICGEVGSTIEISKVGGGSDEMIRLPINGNVSYPTISSKTVQAASQYDPDHCSIHYAVDVSSGPGNDGGTIEYTEQANCVGVNGADLEGYVVKSKLQLSGGTLEYSVRSKALNEGSFQTPPGATYSADCQWSRL